MIIDDQHRFVFIHIPKCAGTSVRQVLKKFDGYEGRWANARSEHPELGKLDLGHLPLSILRQYFPQEYNKVRSYFSVAVLRDPQARFPSSLFQRLEMYGEKTIDKMSRAEMKAALNETMSFLSSDSLSPCLPYDYIHFQPQISYVFDQGERLVNELYTPNKLGTMFQEIGTLVGESVGLKEGPHIGRARVYKSGVSRALGELVKPLYKVEVQRMLPKAIKAYINQTFYNSPQKRFDDLLGTSTVRDFVTTYYADDITLYESMITSSAGDHIE